MGILILTGRDGRPMITNGTSDGEKEEGKGILKGSCSMKEILGVKGEEEKEEDLHSDDGF